jgi:hypothetical protein
VVLGFILSEESSNVSNLLNTSGQNLSLTSELLKCWASFQTSLPAGIHIIGNVCITDKDPFLLSVVEATIPDIIDEVNMTSATNFIVDNGLKYFFKSILQITLLGYLHLF